MNVSSTTYYPPELSLIDYLNTLHEIKYMQNYFKEMGYLPRDLERERVYSKSVALAQLRRIHQQKEGVCVE